MKKKQLEDKLKTFANNLDKRNLMADAIKYTQYKYKNYDTRDRNVYDKIARYSSGSRKN